MSTPTPPSETPPEGEPGPAAEVEPIPAPEGEHAPIATDYNVGQDNIEFQLGPVPVDVHQPVFAISGVTIVAFVVLTLIFQAQVEPLLNGCGRR